MLGSDVSDVPFALNYVVVHRDAHPWLSRENDHERGGKSKYKACIESTASGKGLDTSHKIKHSICSENLDNFGN